VNRLGQVSATPLHLAAKLTHHWYLMTVANSGTNKITTPNVKGSLRRMVINRSHSIADLLIVTERTSVSSDTTCPIAVCTMERSAEANAQDHTDVGFPL
jgi:hypothetical protein